MWIKCDEKKWGGDKNIDKSGGDKRSRDKKGK